MSNDASDPAKGNRRRSVPYPPTTKAEHVKLAKVVDGLRRAGFNQAETIEIISDRLGYTIDLADWEAVMLDVEALT